MLFEYGFKLENTLNEPQVIYMTLYGPSREKTCLRGFEQSEAQTSLLNYRD